MIKQPAKYFINCLSAVKRKHLLNQSINNPLLNKFLPKKHFSDTSIKPPVALFDEFKAATQNKNITIIDVREPQELKDTGIVPSSVNIPLGEVESALKLPNDKFKEKYGIDKPEMGAEIIFSCRMGRRSQTAQDIAIKLGFKNVKNYIGGWLEWEEKIKK